MRLHRVRFTVQALMIAVAVIAAGLAYLHHKRSATFRLRAAANAQKAGECAAKVTMFRSAFEAHDRSLRYGAEYLAQRNRMSDEVAGRRERMVDQLKQALDRSEAILAYYKGLEAKYRRAAAYPWLPVAPDPPPPFAVSPGAGAAVPTGREYDTPPPIAVVASLPKSVFELREHLILGGAIPLTIEYHNRSGRPVTICPIGLAVVAGGDGREPELTAQGRAYQQTSSPGETRRRHASIVLQPGECYRDEGLDLTGLYRLPTGCYWVRVIYDDSPLWAESAPVRFEVQRVKRNR